MKNLKKPFWQALTLGILAGMRTTAAPIAANRLLRNNHSGELKNSPLRVIASDTAGIIFSIAAAGELLGDKLPTTPNRTSPVGLAGRALTGSVAGAAVYKANGDHAAIGALLGFAAAIGAAYTFYLLRKNVVEKTHIADPWIGAAEDAIVAGVGLALINC